MLKRLALTLVLCAAALQSAYAAETSAARYEIGGTSFREIFVNPVTGSDSNSGASASSAYRTVTAAWNNIPEQVTSQGIRVRLAAGNYPESSLPNYWENRTGTANTPIIFQAEAAGVIFQGDINLFNGNYIYFVGFNVTPQPVGDAFHCERCSYILLRDMTLSGGNREAHETIKINQSNHIFIENSDISGAGDNAIDFVSVQYGHVINSRIHNAGDWCAYAKGGSAYLTFEGNIIYNCGTGGLTLGQGTGFEFMDSPWIHFEAYDIKAINNTIYDTEGAGLGVNGGYNILLAHNTLFRVGSRSHALEAVFGERTCDGNPAQCSARNSAGGWGPTTVGPIVYIPNKNVFVFNNLIYNPSPFRSQWSHFAVYGPRSNSVAPLTANTDNNLVFRGNVVSNGPVDLALGVSDNGACDPSNTGCNETNVRAENSINALIPTFLDEANRDLRVTSGSSLPTPVTIPAFPGGDREPTPLAPEGVLANVVANDGNGNARTGDNNLVGAFVKDSVPGVDAPPPPTDTPPTATPASISQVRFSKRTFGKAGGRFTVTGTLSNATSGQLRIPGIATRNLSNGNFRVTLTAPKNRTRRDKRFTAQVTAEGATGRITQSAGTVTVRKR